MGWGVDHRGQVRMDAHAGVNATCGRALIGCPWVREGEMLTFRTLKELASMAGSDRDRTLILWMGVTGATVDEAREATRDYAFQRLEESPLPRPVIDEVRRILLHYVEEHNICYHMWESRKGDGMEPMHRVTVYRAIKGAIRRALTWDAKGAVRVLHALFRAMVRKYDNLTWFLTVLVTGSFVEDVEECKQRVARCSRRELMRIVIPLKRWKAQFAS
ncbi:MAG: hypothetical protein D6819_06585 [Gammaproteobacteria bacterium]|nr:MAG: hypothetical protein D6819_06585 [Gammaproteobacteria bacterium]